MTVKTIPAALQADRDADVGTETRCMVVVAQDGTVATLTELDRPLLIDLDAIPGAKNAVFAGLGELEYLPDPGVETTELEASNDLGVDGGEGKTLIPAPLGSLGIDPDDVRAGKWDDARFLAFALNYEAIDHGFENLCEGYFGNMTTRDNAVLIMQMDGPTRPLKQNMCALVSATCRAVFGSQESEAQEPCGKDVSSLWITFTVTAVDPDDSSRSFEASGLTQDAGYFLPGGVIWDTGANASNTFWGLDTHGAGGVFGFRQAMPRPIQIGDQGRVRIDCTKLPNGDKGCRFHFGDEWVLHFRGEPNIYTAVNAMSPGARGGPGQGGASTQQVAETAEQ